MTDKILRAAARRGAKVINPYADRIDALEREVEALRVDAERYRWLTDDHADHETRAEVSHIGTVLNIRGKGHIDAAIDAARSKT